MVQQLSKKILIRQLWIHVTVWVWRQVTKHSKECGESPHLQPLLELQSIQTNK